MKIEIEVTRNGQPTTERSKLYACNTTQAKRVIDAYLDTVFSAWSTGEVAALKIEVQQ